VTTHEPELAPIVGPERLDDALGVLAGGGVVAIPTDTVYGLAARIDRPGAIECIFAIKGRPTDLALPVLVAEHAQVDQLVEVWPPMADRVAGQHWPGPVTIVVRSRDGLGAVLGGVGGTLGLRLPDHPVVRGLCRRSGPLAVTSANRHGEPPCHTADEVARALSGGGGGDGQPRLGLIVDGGRCDGKPSTVIDCSVSPPRCLREGPVPWESIEAALR